MGRLTTHVLDTASGIPARDMKLRLYECSGDNRSLLKELKTNHDGRCDAPLLDGPSFRPGHYELEFDVSDYFAARGTPQASPPFLNTVPLRFALADSNSHYHVPLLVSPWSYSTYRGS